MVSYRLNDEIELQIVNDAFTLVRPQAAVRIIRKQRQSIND